MLKDRETSRISEFRATNISGTQTSGSAKNKNYLIQVQKVSKSQPISLIFPAQSVSYTCRNDGEG